MPAPIDFSDCAGNELDYEDLSFMWNELEVSGRELAEEEPKGEPRGEPKKESKEGPKKRRKRMPDREPCK